MIVVPNWLLEQMLTDWLRPTRPSLAACVERALAQPGCPAATTREQLRSALRRRVGRMSSTTVILAREGVAAASACVRRGPASPAMAGDGAVPSPIPVWLLEMMVTDYLRPAAPSLSACVARAHAEGARRISNGAVPSKARLRRALQGIERAIPFVPQSKPLAAVALAWWERARAKPLPEARTGAPGAQHRPPPGEDVMVPREKHRPGACR